MFNVKSIALSLSLCFSPMFASAAEPVMLYSRFVANQEYGIMNQFIVDEMNRLQTEYDFRTNVIVGSQGIAAEMRALASIKEGRKALVAGTISNFTFNRVFNPETPNKPGVFIPVINFVSIPAGILVDPAGKINSVDDLVAHLKSKPVAYRATSLGAIGHTFLDLVFRKNKDLTNIKDIQYPIKDIPRNILTGEADYTVSSLEGNDQFLKPIMITKGSPNKKYANIPTADSLGMPDFIPITSSLIYVPADHGDFAVKVKDLLLTICLSEKFTELASRFNLDKECIVDTKSLNEIVDTHNQLITKYKD